jgi:DNA-directed RNA polymerase subunit RPC12/RpoP
MKVCSICGKPIENENAPILTISGFGNARYLCDECSDEMDVAMTSRDVEEIEAAVSVLGEKMEKCHDDQATATLFSFINVACERLSKIKEGTYDFAIDERMKEIADEEGMDEIPEELQETEEDKALDAEDAKKQEKFDKIMNWLTIGAIAITAIVLIIRFIG